MFVKNIDASYVNLNFFAFYCPLRMGFQADFRDDLDKITIHLKEESPVIVGETKFMFFSSNKVRFYM